MDLNDLNDLNKVWEVKPLKKDLEDDARKILERVAKQVQPIMRKRKWRVKILSEFCPANPSLLGLNIGGGAEIKLRLRWPSSDWNFLQYEQILDTMLHELCHNEYGPHNTDFYNLLDEIRKECEDLMAKGITGTGQGFDLPGRRLGGDSRPPTLQSLRQTALAAAENRARRGALMPSGPKSLGGDKYIKAVLSPTQAAAMAAERRLRDDQWCGSNSVDGNQNIVSSVESCEKSNASIAKFGESSQTPPHDSITHQDSIHDQATWQCCVCTLLNQALAARCEACGTDKVRKGKGKGKVERIWSCKFCTLDNSGGVERCMACGEWRYSHGPPSSLSAPYLGT